jgi:Icc-related predicted phosphoesterase
MATRRLREWEELAGARVKVPVYVSPGNDDEFYVDKVLAHMSTLCNVEGKVVELPRGYLMASTGWANRTPWQTPREMDEPELLTKLKGITSALVNMSRAVFNLHIPPKDSGLDSCFAVSQDLRVVTDMGQPRTIGGGSEAVREVLTECQPMLGLHGHIHESRGFVRIGRTLSVNPGSEYSEGILRGVLLKLDGPRVADFQFTSG